MLVPSEAPTPLLSGSLFSKISAFFRISVFCVFLFPGLCLSNESHETDVAAPLPADQAFVLKAEKNDQTIQLRIKIAPGYLLYAEHLLFNWQPKDMQPVPIQASLPTSVTKQDPILGDHQVYKDLVIVNIPMPTTTEQTLDDLLVSYQGCSNDGFCYAPEGKRIHIQQEGELQKTLISDMDPEQLVPLSPPSTSETKSASLDSTSGSESDRLTQLLHSQKPALTLCLFLGLGLLLAFTPCVLPMIPILANILVGSGKPLATGRAIFLASLYILSVALCYGMAGVMAGLLGNHWQAALQQPPFLIGFSLLLILFALSQFNLLTLRAPAFVSNALNRIQQIENKQQKQGSVLGAISMGVISALVASPCVTPALVGALTYISQTGNALFGGLALFMMSLGMGLPLLGVATVGSRFLPKAGAWMVRVKMVTGVFLLILAATILWRAIPSHTTEFLTIETPDQLTHVLEKAKKLNKPVILDVYAQWCVSCQRMDHAIFQPNQTKRLNSQYHLLRLDITKLDKGHKELLAQLGIMGPPTVLFFNTAGEELKNLRLVGEINKPDFLKHMNRFENTLNLSKTH